MKTLLIGILFFLSTAAHATTIQITIGGFGAHLSDMELHLGMSGENFTITNNGGRLEGLLSVARLGQPYDLGAVGTFSDSNSKPGGAELPDELIYNGITYSSYTGKFTVVSIIPHAKLGLNAATFTMTGHIDGHTDTDILDLDIFGSGTAGTNLTSIGGDFLDARAVGYTFTATAPAIPEPSTWLLVGSGLAGLILWRKRRA